MTRLTLPTSGDTELLKAPPKRGFFEKVAYQQCPYALPSTPRREDRNLVGREGDEQLLSKLWAPYNSGSASEARQSKITYTKPDMFTRAIALHGDWPSRVSLSYTQEINRAIPASVSLSKTRHRLGYGGDRVFLYIETDDCFWLNGLSMYSASKHGISCLRDLLRI